MRSSSPGTSSRRYPGSRGEQDGARRVLVAALCLDNLVLSHRVDRGDGLGGQDLHAEALDLGPDPVGELAAADSVREARIVVDPLGYAGLAPDAAALDDKRVDAFAGRVQGRRESGWPSPYDYQIIVLPLGPGADSQLGGQLSVGGLHEDGAILEHDGRYYLPAVVGLVDVPAAFLVLVYVYPGIRDALLAQKLLRASAVGAPGGPVDGYRLLRHRMYLRFDVGNGIS